ncbi:hypothetical protein JCM3765_003966 [Sporobolomyces pararoseus]
MSIRSKRSFTQSFNYQEVESDADLDSDEAEQVGLAGGAEHGKGDTYGTGPKQRRRKKCKIKHSNKPEPSEDPQGSAKLLSEIIINLTGSDVIALAKVNRELHNLIVRSPMSHSIWSALRRKDGFELPEEMSEIAFAVLVYSEGCQAHHMQPNSSRLEKASSAGSLLWRRRFVIKELEEVHHILCDLEAEDEINSLETALITTSRPRARRTGAGDFPRLEPVKVSAVEAFVQERQQWVSEQKKISSELSATYYTLRQKQHCKNREEFEKFSQRRDWLQTELGWTEKETRSYYFEDDQNFGSEAADWNKRREMIRRRIEKVDREDERNTARSVRVETVLEYRGALEEATVEVDPSSEIFPTENEFLEMTSVRRLWNPIKAVIDDETWEATLPAIQEELKRNYYPKVRLETIRGLVAAREDLNIPQTSDNPSDYPPSIYNDQFFSLATSIFTDYDSRFPHDDDLLICQYPSTTAFNFSIPTSFQHRTSFRQVYLITSILESAGLDPEYTTIGDLDSMEGEWTWTNHPKKSKRRHTFDWFSLFKEALAVAPSAPKLRAGKGVHLKYVPSASELGEDM